MQKTPAVDISECNICDGCLDISPDTFVFNDDLGFIQVVDLEKYNKTEVEEIFVLLHLVDFLQLDKLFIKIFSQLTKYGQCQKLINGF